MTLRLYHNAASPFVRKVMVVLHETGQLDDVELVFAKGTLMAPGLMPLARNPLGKIPALDRPDGSTLHDSRVICRYLDARARAGTGARQPVRGLYPPDDSSALWEVLTLEAIADGIMEAAVLMVYETRLRQPHQVVPEIMDAQWQRILRCLECIEERWMDHLAGPLHLGQIALGCALGYLDFRHGARDWRRDRMQLADWHAAFCARESMAATMPHAI